MSFYDSQVQHVAGAVVLTAPGAEQQLLSALGGLITVNAGSAGSGEANAQGAYVVVFNNGVVALPFVALACGQQTHGSLACGCTKLALVPAAGELATLQLQIGPVLAGSRTEHGDVLTLVLSAERSAPGAELAFLGQAVGGHGA